MNGYIFDWNENSEKILKSGEYTTVGHQFMEQVALFRYLMDEGKTKNEVDEIWRGTNSIIYQKCCGDVDEIERLFARIWGKAAKWKGNFKGNEIVIYQSEINFINNMEVLPWIKQYVLTLLCIYKWWGKEWCKYDKRMRTFCFSCTDAKRERDNCADLLHKCVEKYNPYIVKIIDSAISFKITFCRNERPVARISNPREVKQLLGFIMYQKTCLMCGSVFEYTSHTYKIDVCPNCKKKLRHKAQAALHRKSTGLRQK